MAFEGPTDGDFSNVQALNRVLLDIVASDARAIAMPGRLAERLAGLDAAARAHVAKAPVLLLSIAEDDAERWAPVFTSRPDRDLFSALNAPPPRVADLAAATLAFLWQLAARDAYAVRVISGAPVEWCQALKRALLVDVLEFCRHEPGLVSLRHADSETFWDRLLTGATADEQSIRLACRLAALQAMLTGSADASRRPTRRAASSMRPAASVAGSDPP